MNSWDYIMINTVTEFSLPATNTVRISFLRKKGFKKLVNRMYTIVH
jgi:hypothetical protein